MGFKSAVFTFGLPRGSDIKESAFICFFVFIMSLHPKSLQSCLTLCDPIDYSSPGSVCPWDSPGKDTGVAGRALIPKIKSSFTYKIGLSACLISYP